MGSGERELPLNATGNPDTPLPSFFQRRVRSLRNSTSALNLYTPAQDVSISGSTPTSPSMNSDEQSSNNSSRFVIGRSLPKRRSRFNNNNDEESVEDTAGMRSDINEILNTKARTAQLEDDPTRLDVAENQGAFVLRPDMRLRRFWDMYVLVLLMYVATVSVFVFSFLGVLGVTSPWFWVERFIDLSFTLDIFLHFFTAYERIGVLVTDRKLIRRHYARTWLVPDILATFPWDVLGMSLQEDGAKPNILQLPRYIRLVRLFKLIRLTKILRLKQGFTNLEIKLRLKYGHIRLAGLFLSVVLIAHWFACLFFYFGSIGGSEMNWIAQEGIPTGLYGRYIAALYFSMYTITTIGFGDVVPENTLERSFTTVIMFLGAAVFAYIISQVSNIASELNESSAHHRRIMDSLTDFAKYRELPHELAYDIRRYFQREHLRQRVAHEKQLLEAINRDLRIKVLKHMYGTHLEKSHLFRDIPPGHLDDVYNSVTERLARKDEKLFSEGDEPNCFYIIRKGNVSLATPGLPVIHYSDNGILGDNDILFNRPRSSSAVCTGYTELIVVPRASIMSTLDRHPNARKSLCDEEALGLWDKALHLVEEQIRYSKIASQLRARGYSYMLQRGVNIEQPVAAVQEGAVRHYRSAPVASEQGQLPLANRAAVAGSSDASSQDHMAAGNENRNEAQEDTASENSVDVMRTQLEEKTEQVQRLESKLVDLKDQLDIILRGVRGEI